MKETPSILFLGDSLTEGYRLTSAESFPSIIQQKLKKEGLNYKVINGGISGDTTGEALARVDGLFRAHSNIQVLIIFLGANDAFNQIDPAVMKRNLEEIVDRARSYVPGLDIYLVRFPAMHVMSPSYGRRFENAFRETSEAKNIQLMPFFLEGVFLKPHLALPDGVHPNAEGMALVAENVWQAMLEQEVIPGLPEPQSD